MFSPSLVGILVFGSVIVRQWQVQAQTQTKWGQCGGEEYTGPVACPTNFICTYGNPWYSQCVPPEALEEAEEPGEFTWVPDEPIDTATRVTTVTVVQGPAPTIVTTMITYLTPRPSDGGWGQPPETTDPGQQPLPIPPETVTVGGTTMTLIPDTPVTPRPKPRGVDSELETPKQKKREPEAAVAVHKNIKKLEKETKKRDTSPATANKRSPTYGPFLDVLHPLPKRMETPRILEAGQYWIRSVVAPNYHKYLQTSPENTPSVALIDSHLTAGQYSIQSGQVVSHIPFTSSDSGGDMPLYLQVEHPEDLTQRKLKTWFNTTENAFGTFAWQGDALTWSHPDVKRQNLAAWLVCEGQELFINTGAYAYETPSGCADQTIHYYNDATAND